jgi:hypothetical protein
MSVDYEFKREVEQAMRDDARLLAALRALLEQAWAFVTAPETPEAATT